jgi:acetyl esterase
MAPHEARRAFATEVATLKPLFFGHGPRMTEEREILIEPLALRAKLYRPSPGTLPLVMFFHGGGWVVGNPDTHDTLARELAAAAGAVVLSVDYRLAPEHPFPAAMDDAYASTCWAVEHAVELSIDPLRVAVAGDSAGGNLAAVTAQRARDSGGPRLAAQCLIYPVTNAAFDTKSYLAHAEGYGLTRARMQWYWQMYAPEAKDRESPYASPAKATSLAGLPPATVLTAEHDVLRDEGDHYAEALYHAGNDVAHRRVSGVTHGYIMMGRLLRSAGLSVEFIGERLRRAFGESR